MNKFAFLLIVLLLIYIVIGVVEYLSTGGVETNHKDFKELRYNESLTNFSYNGKNGTTNGRITHGFKLKSAYENGLMPYTNYTFDFKVRLILHRDYDSLKQIPIALMLL